MAHESKVVSFSSGGKDAAAAFEQVRRELRAEFGNDTWRSWLEPLSLHAIHGGVVYLRAPSGVVRDWAQTYAQHRIEARLGALLPLDGPVLIEVEERLRGLVGQAVAAPANGAGEAAPAIYAPAQQTFAGFCVGDSNRGAAAAARAIAEGGAAANLVLFHGLHGVGKTHLISAIAHEAKKRDPARRVRLMHATIFIEKFQNAIHKLRDVSGFKAEVRENDVLLIDDVQRIAAKPATEMELFDTIAYVIARGGQVVLTADHGPEGLDGFDKRLANQLKGAVDCFIDQPDFELRRKILEAKVKHYAEGAPGFSVPGPVLDMIASRIAGAGRVLDGAVKQLVMSLGYNQREVTMESAEIALRGRFSQRERKPSVDSIIQLVAKHFSMNKEQLLRETHQRSIARPRQIAMYLCRQHTARSLPDLAHRFGGKHHTTVLYAVKKVNELMSKDAQVRRDVEALERQILTGM